MSDLTLPLIALTTLVGYFFSKGDRSSRETESVRQGIEQFDKPNGNNIYTSNVVDEANNEVMNRSLYNYKSAQAPSDTGYIPPYFNTYGEVGSDKLSNMGLSSEQLGKINELNRISNVFRDKTKTKIEKRPMFNPSIGDGAPINYIGKEVTEEEGEINILTGKPFEKDHNNMTPFFGSNVKQNMETFSNESLLDNYSGNVSTFKHKSEIGSLYDKKPENIYGNGVFSASVNMDRYIPSLYRENERPVEPERISAPKSGTFENNIRPTFKDVNELRPGNKPKETYDGRTLSGKMGETRGVIGKLEKNRPDTFFENEHRFSGPGEFIAPKIREDYSINMKHSSRQDYNTEYYGIQTSMNKSSTQRLKTVDNSDELAGMFQTPKRNNFENDFGRNLNGNIINSQSGHDYGRSGITLYEQERVTTGDKVQMLNANIQSLGIKVRHQDEAKTTSRETLETVDNSGNVSSTYKVSSNSPYIVGISDVLPKQTTKETMVDNKYKGQVYKNDGMGYVVNKYDAKITGKQILSENIKDYMTNPNFNSESESRDRFNNAVIRDDKQDVLMGERPSGPQNFQTSSGKESFGDVKLTQNMLLKEQQDKRRKIINDYSFTPSKEQLGLVMRYRDDNEPIDTVTSDRLQPELVHSQLQNNPFLIKNKGVI